MTHHDLPDRDLVAWLSDDATRRAPGRLLDAVVADTRTRPQLPGWLVTMRGESMGAQPHASNRSRSALLAFVLIALIALIAAFVAGGPRRPDGLLAFIRDGDVYVANADGSGARMALRHDGAKFVTVAWSPVASRLAVDNEDVFDLPDPGVVILDIPSGVVRTVGGHNPVWSPDGRELAVLHQASAGDLASVRIRFVTLDTLTERADFPFDAIGGLAWSPNGRWIAATGGEESRSIVRIDVAVGTVIQIDGPSGHLDSPKEVAWAPDSQHLAFIRYHVGTQLPGCTDSENCDIAVFVSDADGSHARRVSATPGHADLPLWSPDGKWIAFRHSYQNLSAAGPGGSGIRLVRPDGTEEHQVVAASMQGFEWGSGGAVLRYAVSQGPTVPSTIWEATMTGDAHSMGVTIDNGSTPFEGTGLGFDWQARP